MSAAASQNYEVSVETGAGLERRMTVRVPTAEIQREIDARLAKVGKTAKLKGFRPGKVPEKVVRQYYGGQVRDEVLSDVIRASYSRAIAEQKLSPAGGPRIEPITGAGESEHFSYRATFEVYPEIALQPLETLAIEVPTVEIGEADVAAMIQKLRAQRATWQVVEREAERDDRVTIDYMGSIDGEPFQGGQGKDVPMTIGAGQVLPDFEQGLIGLSAGQTKHVPVAFPSEYPAANLAGKTAEFAITAHRVEAQVLPEVDEQFATLFGITEGGVEALRTEVRSNMARELGERLKSETKTRTFDALIKANAVAVPRALVDQEIANLQQDALRQMGVTDPKQAPAPERFQSLAQRRVTVGLLIQELLKHHKIKLDALRVEQRVKELSSAYEKPEEAAQFYRTNRGMMAQVEAAVLEDQVVDFLVEHGKTRQQELAFKDFMEA